MSDPTTARDRIETIVYTHLERREIRGTGGLAYDIANDVLRALAGAPTADVAECVVERVAGRCPSCRGASLFLGAGGHVTCSRLDCPAPCAVDDQLTAAPEGVAVADEQDA